MKMARPERFECPPLRFGVLVGALNLFVFVTVTSGPNRITRRLAPSKIPSLPRPLDRHSPVGLADLRQPPEPGELAQECGPEHLGLRRADVHAENFAPAIAVDADGGDHRDQDDARIPFRLARPIASVLIGLFGRWRPTKGLQQRRPGENRADSLNVLDLETLLARQHVAGY